MLKFLFLYTLLNMSLKTFYRHYQNVAENVYERGAATAKSVNYKHSKKIIIYTCWCC